VTVEHFEDYSATETLRDGRKVEIRALRPTDRPALKEAVDQTSPLSLYRRFFTVKKSFTESEAHFFIDVDFKEHVVIVAIVDEDNHPAIVGGGRYVLIEKDKAEVAFTVIDAYQGKGVGSMLLRHLTGIARIAGLQQFVAEVLPENVQMLKMFEKSGLRMTVRAEPQVTHVTLDL